MIYNFKYQLTYIGLLTKAYGCDVNSSNNIPNIKVYIKYLK